jgi:AraC-like DNA-binding protein
MSKPAFHLLTKAFPHATLYQRGAAKRYGDAPQVHNELVVLLGLSGRGRYLLDNRFVTLGRGGMLWAPPGAAHMLVSDSGGFDMWVCVAHPALWGRAALAGLPIGLRRIGAEALAELDHLATGIAATAPPDRADGLKWYLSRARMLWSAAAPEVASPDLHAGIARAAHALRLDPALPLEQARCIAGLSRSRFGERFAQEIGKTPGAFRTEQRLARADQALAAGASLTQAALEAGFGSYSQFFRDFQKVRGMPPRVWYAVGKEADRVPASDL